MRGLSVGSASALFASVFACAACSAAAEGSATRERETGAAGEVDAVASTSARAPTVPAAIEYPPCEEPGRYEIEDDVVVDTANGARLWQRAVDLVQRSQPEAAAYCAALVFGGLCGWRLPEIHELQSLRLRPSGLQGGPKYCMPSIDQAAFPATPAAEFWSATTREVGDGLYTGFDDGRTHPADSATPMYARCVHDAVVAEAPAP